MKGPIQAYMCSKQRQLHGQLLTLMARRFPLLATRLLRPFDEFFAQAVDKHRRQMALQMLRLLLERPKSEVGSGHNTLFFKFWTVNGGHGRSFTTSSHATCLLVLLTAVESAWSPGRCGAVTGIADFAKCSPATNCHQGWFGLRTAVVQLSPLLKIRNLLCHVSRRKSGLSCKRCRRCLLS